MDLNSKLIGHDKTFYNFVDLYKKKKLPKKILIKGYKGIGKFLFCIHFLNYVFSFDEEYVYDLNNLKINLKNRSYMLFKNKSHPNISIIDKHDDKKNIEISQIRKLSLFHNSSTFNNKSKFIVINDIANLNLNSTNALLKSIEDPNENIFYILTYNTGNKIQDTLRSRCVEFKLKLGIEDVKIIIDDYFSDNIYETISSDFINHYSNPSFLISLISYLNKNNLDHKNLTIENLINFIIDNKDYIKNNFINENLNILIELFFYKNINISNNLKYNLKKYFYLKLNEIKKYNLDMEIFFLEFRNQLLNE